MKMLPPAGNGAKLRLVAITKNEQSVVMKDMRDGIGIVFEILLVAQANILADILELHKDERQAIDKAHNIRTPPVEVAPNPELPHTEKMVVQQLIKIENPQPMFQSLPFLILKGNQHPVAEECVLLTIRRQQRLRCRRRNNLTKHVIISRVRQSRIQLHQLRPEHARQHHLPVIPAPLQTFWAEILAVMGKRVTPCPSCCSR